jgi:hypothetical protein
MATGWCTKRSGRSGAAIAPTTACEEDRLSAHAEPAGFMVVRDGGGFVALTGPGLTEGVNESPLTTDALWLVVTGKPGEGGSSPSTPSTAVPPQRPCATPTTTPTTRSCGSEPPGPKIEPASAAQTRYLDNLTARVSRDQLQTEYDRAVKGTGIAPLQTNEEPGPALRQLTKAAARRLNTALVSATPCTNRNDGNPWTLTVSPRYSSMDSQRAETTTEAF